MYNQPSSKDDTLKLAKILICRGVPHYFDYKIPKALHARVGSHVMVPFGKSKARGLVMDIVTSDETTNSDLKAITDCEEENTIPSVLIIDLQPCKHHFL